MLPTRRIFTALFIFLIPVFGLAQQPRAKKKPGFTKAQLKIMGSMQIQQLHDGALLVRLKTKKSSIAALRKIGKNQLANKIEQEQADLNKEIVSAFKSNYDFSKTYFFFSDYSQQVREKKFDQVQFLNENLQPDSSIKFSHQTFLTAEFGNIEQDTVKYPDSQNLVTTEKGLERQSGSYSSPSLGFGALLIKSDQFVQLRRPFPFYSRTYSSLPIFRRTPEETVRKLNMALRKFYSGEGN